MLRWTGAIALLLLATAGTATLAGESFPIVGTYMRDIVCKGNGSDHPDLLVKITQRQIDSQMGACTILNWKRDGNAVKAHLECKVPGGQVLLGDVTFTLRDDKTLGFEDQDHTSDGTLYKCAG